MNYLSLIFGALLLMPQCSNAQDEPEADAAINVVLPRHHDEAPAVEPERRYQLPVDTRIAIAGNYGELRPDHFHAGLDFKTDQTVGHPVYSFADGFVRRAAINAYGYGQVLYVEHPDMGLTSVYAHLDGFNDAIWSKIRQCQVEGELNNADITFSPDELPVREGDVIAISGNTGSSGGPHVHFELRNIPSQLAAATGREADADDDIYYDPQMYFLRELKDTQAPRISQVYLYPQDGEGLAGGTTHYQVSQVTGICASRGGEGGKLTKPLTAWGRVGLGLKAYDYMDEQDNKYGVKVVRLYLEVPYDSTEIAQATQPLEPRYRLIYQMRQDVFRYSEQRFTNSLTDYEAWITRRSMIMKSFIEPANRLQQLDHTLGDGIVTFDEERPYHFVYELEDAHGNLTSLDFDVQGKRADLPQPKPHTRLWVDCLEPFSLDTLGCRLDLKAGTFYRSQELPFSVADGIYSIGTQTLPWHDYAQLTLARPDSLVGDDKAYLCNLDNGAFVCGGNTTADGGRIRTSGRYTWQRDTVPPEVSMPRFNLQRSQVRVGDVGSGVARFRVIIDGQFVPFDMNNTGRYFGSPALYGVKGNGPHTVVIEAWDKCGNYTRQEIKK